ncbi:MAG: hypothetical protein JSV26_03725 [bacterium]|nr:MAG: hypothetical protein JSV26_03725 [bacterium]
MSKRGTLITAVSLTIVLAGYGLVQAHGGWSDRDYARGWGHMGGYGGHMMDYGHMGYGSRNYDYEPCWTDSSEAKRADINKETAEEMITRYLSRTNPRLEVGKVTGTDDGFEVQVVTKKGQAIVDKFLVEKDTGRVYRLYE